jgi:type I restriction enzyme M protein
MIETAREGTGKVGVVVPHGVLFRGAAEGKIRQKLIEENLLEAVIGLPANLFFGTGIPAAILIFNKGRTTGDVLFIDASREYKDAKNQSLLTDEHLQKIVDTYTAFQTVEKYAYRATPQEIADNDFNLNIPRYVDTFEEEAEIDLDTVKADITRLESELATVRGKMQAYLEELGV